MELYIDSELRGDTLFVTAGGVVRLDSVWRLLLEACEIARVQGVEKIIVDCLEVEGELAAFERYRLGSDLAEFLLRREIRVRLAFVGGPPAVNGFGMRIARNRGIAAEVFASHDEAIRWVAIAAESASA